VRTSSKSSCEQARDVSQLSCRRHKSIYAVSSVGAPCSLHLTHVYHRLRDHLRQLEHGEFNWIVLCLRLSTKGRRLCDLHDEHLAYCKLYCEHRIFVLFAFECRQSRRERNVVGREFRLNCEMTIAMLKFLRAIFLNYLLSFSILACVITNIRKL